MISYYPLNRHFCSDVITRLSLMNVMCTLSLIMCPSSVQPAEFSWIVSFMSDVSVTMSSFFASCHQHLSCQQTVQGEFWHRPTSVKRGVRHGDTLC